MMKSKSSLIALLTCLPLSLLFASLLNTTAPRPSLAAGKGATVMFLPLAQNSSRAAGGTPTPTPTSMPSPTATAVPTVTPSPTPAVLAGAGDIAECGDQDDEETAALLDDIQGIVFTAGDNAYPSGTAQDFEECYDPSWGRHKARTRPAAGNHDYATGNAGAYFDYFGPAAGPRDLGYYSYDLGAWHIIVLNTNCHFLDGGCDAGSPQETWLREDLAADPSRCTLAYFHHPLFSSGSHGGSAHAAAFWQALYEYGADVVLSGHDHLYERFAPQDPQGNVDPRAGIRQFTVGAGGRVLYDAANPVPNSEFIVDESYGVLKLTLHPNAYDWQFIPTVSDPAYRDAGAAVCH